MCVCEILPFIDADVQLQNYLIKKACALFESLFSFHKSGSCRSQQLCTACKNVCYCVCVCIGVCVEVVLLQRHLYNVPFAVFKFIRE